MRIPAQIEPQKHKTRREQIAERLADIFEMPAADHRFVPQASHQNERNSADWPAAE